MPVLIYNHGKVVLWQREIDARLEKLVSMNNEGAC